MNKKRIALLMICFLALATLFVDNGSIYAKQCHKKEKTTLYFRALGSGGAPLYTSVDVCLDISEDYTVYNKNVKFTKRNAYYYATKKVNNIGAVGYRTILTRHFKSDGTVLDTFSWQNESGIYPSCDFSGSKVSSRSVSYSRNNSYYAQASIIVSVDGALVPQKAQSAKYSLKV